MVDWEQKKRIGRLETETIFLENSKRYGRVTFDTVNGAWVKIGRFPVGDQYNLRYVQILIDIPTHSPGYPQISPDWFWIDEDLRTKNGKEIKNLQFNDSIPQHQKYRMKGWAHFSFHLRSWNPKSGRGTEFTRGDSLVSFLRAIEGMFHDLPDTK